MIFECKRVLERYRQLERLIIAIITSISNLILINALHLSEDLSAVAQHCQLLSRKLLNSVPQVNTTCTSIHLSSLLLKKNIENNKSPNNRYDMPY